jgi:hypothetical protein
MRHTMPVVLLLALYGMFRKRLWIFAATLVPFLIYPLAGVRSEDRFVLPYVPFLIVCAVVGLEQLRSKGLRSVVYGLLLATVIVLAFFNKDQLLKPEAPGLGGMKEAGLLFKDKIQPRARIASRKPFFAFYAGGDYLEIPVAPYEDVMKFLVEEEVELLALHHLTIHRLRPALRPLMYSRTVMNGELRYQQVHVGQGGAMVFRRAVGADPLRWSRITRSPEANVFPCWSPDGKSIAFRRHDSSGPSEIFVTDAAGGSRRVYSARRRLNDGLAWSPDGARLAFADAGEEGLDIFAVDLSTGAVSALVTDAGDARSPSWCATTGELVFCSNRSGNDDIWVRDMAAGDEVVLAAGAGNGYPSLSPDGSRVAWVEPERGIAVLDRRDGAKHLILAPRHVMYAPAWSPDGKYVAVTAQDWGSWDIYLAKSDGTSALLLTKEHKREGTPQWSPDGRRLLIMSEQEGTVDIWALGGLDPYLRRLETPLKVQTFLPPSK